MAERHIQALGPCLPGTLQTPPASSAKALAAIKPLHWPKHNQILGRHRVEDTTDSVSGDSTLVPALSHSSYMTSLSQFS